MFCRTFAGFVVAVIFSASAAHATIVNLNADPNQGAVNAGHNSGPYPYNPQTLTLTAGTYNVSLSGIAAGGQYDAYAVATPASPNWTDIAWSVSLDGATAAFTQANLGRYATPALANAAYSNAGYTFTLASAQQVAFYVDDTVSLWFGDDTGGVSLNVSKVPEPASLGLLLVGATGLIAARRRNKAASVA